ncbi:tRNA (adenosine(37)-N6)-dimethylallyltransferase MiaA [Xanthobacter tagetidis]|jgi:tRNA dimethylallyltransferase|uniref:tRNA dimethylallyltransferase n=1 Tax=Xanthobacter tagetidis TaxID=60216 RepID=A0A3L7AJF7_9HYPH|nr:tRNA (adenosine(37)-N6)-dimethylallyltransferase MiaA [Xanthobacter tagetidis]RLP80367.1 tRNA (adenosine(37)-N6)-dimethylallyltransferase MiaA [Xanthobacter tagetidis]
MEQPERQKVRRQKAPKVVLIAGPTASGKSALALALAERLGADARGVVLNADSMQVYGDLSVITARPSVADLGRAPHLLYGHVDADTDYSVGRWTDDARDAIAALRAEGRTPILVGGTGLYFRALTQGLAAVPPIPPEVREGVRGRAEGEANAALHARLLARDPATGARLNVNDRQRVLRALEVLEATGRPLAQWQADAQPPVLAPEDCVRLVLVAEREELRRRIDARFLAMLDQGALAEVAALAARGLDAARPVLKAHGVPALMRHLAGEIGLDAAAAEGQADTRRYAKRQDTFFRHQMADWPRATPEGALGVLTAALDA